MSQETLNDGYGTGDVQTTPTAISIETVLNFLTEFNTNAAIFNEILAPFMAQTLTVTAYNSVTAFNANSTAETAYNNGLRAMGEILSLKGRVQRLEGGVGADDPDFQTDAHLAE
ncbi:MAG: hypothetical protein ACFE0Q_10010 [Anaerolineae bacterium]